MDGAAFELGISSSSLMHNKDNDINKEEDKEIVCESLSVSFDALRLNCPAGSIPIEAAAAEAAAAAAAAAAEKQQQHLGFYSSMQTDKLPLDLHLSSFKYEHNKETNFLLQEDKIMLQQQQQQQQQQQELLLQLQQQQQQTSLCVFTHQETPQFSCPLPGAQLQQDGSCLGVLHICLFIYLFVYLFIYLFVCFLCLFVSLFICLFIYLSIHLYIYLVC